MAKELTHEDLIKRIEESNFFKKYGCKSWRLCGSSTYIAPITHWVENKEIVIEIDSLVSHKGMTNSFKALFNDLSKDFALDEWHYNKNDGSCPQEYVIYYVEEDTYLNGKGWDELSEHDKGVVADLEM